MNLLFVHQNFPGQFKHLVAHLSQDPANTVVGMGYVAHTPAGRWRYVRCATQRGNDPGIHPLLLDTESKVLRGEATHQAALQLKAQGFTPDVIVGHPGWGECLFLKDVWPTARLGLYAEFFYRRQGQDVGFDAEFPDDDAFQAPRLRMKNTAMLHALAAADGAYAPTQWQASTFPDMFRRDIAVVHDGVDTGFYKPNPGAFLELNGQRLDAATPVVTFVARHLEPCRGFHTFMRALPGILERNPRCRIVVVGGTDAGYGAMPAQGGTWLDALLGEVGARLDPSRVHFVGKVPLPTFLALMQISSAHVYLTYPFVLSWSLLQAMSCEALVVGSRTVPVEEAIEDGVNGLLADFFSPAGVASAVTRALQERDALAPLRKRARESVIARYDLKSVCLPRQLQWIESLR